MSQNNAEFLKYLVDHQNESYWKEILNTSYNMLPHKLEILNSEILKNKFEIKKIIIENLDSYLFSKELAIKMSLEIEKVQNNIKNSLELIQLDNFLEKKCDQENLRIISRNLQYFSLLFEPENFIKIIARKGNGTLVGKSIVFLKFLLSSYPDENKSKFTLHLEKLLEKIQELIIDKYINAKLSSQNINEITEITLNILNDSSEKNQLSLLNDLFVKDVKINIYNKVEKYHFSKGSFEYLWKMFLIYKKNIEKSLVKIMKLYEKFSGEEKGLIGKIQSLEKVVIFFEKNYSLLVKHYNENGSFLELLSRFPFENSKENYLLMFLKNLLEDHLQKLLRTFDMKTQILIRYAHINNFFINLLKKVDNSSLDDTLKFIIDESFMREEKIQKVLNLVKKSEFFSLFYNNFISVSSFCGYYLKDKIKIEKFNSIFCAEIKNLPISVHKYLETKKNIKEEDRNRITMKIEKFIDIILILIEKGCYL